MGILDDAIREHLELKRKHGVPEDEVERQEEEALGPARRDVAQQPGDDEIAADAGDDASLFDAEEGDAPVAETPAVEHPPAVEEPEAPSDHQLAEAGPTVLQAPPVEPPSDEPPVSSAPPADAAPAEPFSEEPPEPATAEPPAAETPPPPDPHEALGDTEPHGFPALDEDELDEADLQEDDESRDEPLPPSDAEDELDVLEDTPDFLQETPEHDRLWFEQKPPRDFDFD